MDNLIIITSEYFFEPQVDLIGSNINQYLIPNNALLDEIIILSCYVILYADDEKLSFKKQTNEI